jgi:hypothetical protein
MTNSTILTKSSSYPDNWNDLYKSDQPLDMDAFLNSDLFAAKRNHEMQQSIPFMVSGLISFIASMLLIIHILRSHECLSTTYHRLIFGLSTTDIISSFSHALSSTMVPKEMNYLAPFASGNTVTCDAQGFVGSYMAGVSVGYTCSICFYYLAIISYNKKFDSIRRNLEPWFHGISILFPLIICVILLATNTFNSPFGGTCYPEPYYPPHCIGYEAGDIPKGYSIPCGRGGESDDHAELRTKAMFVGCVWVLFIPPVIILVTMTNMFWSVSKVEKKMQNYGVGALRLRASRFAPPPTAADNSADQQEARCFVLRMKKLGKYLCLTGDAAQTNNRCAICFLRCPCSDNGIYDPERPSPPGTTKSNKMACQKRRAVLHMAFGYAGAWLIVWTPNFFGFVSMLVQKSVDITVVSHTVRIAVAFMTPMQGFFNFIVFMAPKVRTTRTMAMRQGAENSNQNQLLTWCQAFHKVYISRGRRLEDRNMRNNNRMERRSTRVIIRKMLNESFRVTLERMKSFTTSSLRTVSTEITETNKCSDSGRYAATSP